MLQRGVARALLSARGAAGTRSISLPTPHHAVVRMESILCSSHAQGKAIRLLPRTPLPAMHKAILLFIPPLHTSGTADRLGLILPSVSLCDSAVSHGCSIGLWARCSTGGSLATCAPQTLLCEHLLGELCATSRCAARRCVSCQNRRRCLCVISDRSPQ